MVFLARSPRPPGLPNHIEGLPFTNRLDRRKQETTHLAYDRSEVWHCVSEFNPAEKSLPHRLPVSGEFISQAIRQRSRQRRLTCHKYRVQCGCQGFAFERQGAAHRPEVVKVLHTAIHISKGDEGLGLFRDHGFLGIRVNPGRRETEHGRKDDLPRRGNDNVAKPDINLKPDFRLLQRHRDKNTETAVDLAFTNLLSPHRSRVEPNSILFDFHSTCRPDNLSELTCSPLP